MEKNTDVSNIGVEVKGNGTHFSPSDSSESNTFRLATFNNYRETSRGLPTRSSTSKDSKLKDGQKVRITKEINRATNKITQLIDDMISAEDFVDQGNLGYELMDYLNDLWELRNEREADFGDLVNLIQLTFKDHDFEFFPKERLQKIKEILNTCLKTPAVSASEVRLAMKLLREAGFDPWNGIKVEVGGRK